MLSKRHELTEVDGKPWLHEPWESLWSTGEDTHQEHVV